jgi:hypothetical protein
MATSTADHREEVVGMATAIGNDREEVVATTPDALREQALQRLKKRRDFKAHLFVYALVNTVIWGIWFVVAANSHSWWPWPVFLTLFWGIGVVMNAWDVYLRKPITEEELQREVDHLGGAARARP